MKISISRNSIFRYGGNTLSTVLFSIIYGATVFAITTPGLVPANVLWYGQAANIPMIVLGINIIIFLKQYISLLLHKTNDFEIIFIYRKNDSSYC